MEQPKYPDVWVLLGADPVGSVVAALRAEGAPQTDLDQFVAEVGDVDHDNPDDREHVIDVVQQWVTVMVTFDSNQPEEGNKQ